MQFDVSKCPVCQSINSGKSAGSGTASCSVLVAGLVLLALLVSGSTISSASGEEPVDYEELLTIVEGLRKNRPSVEVQESDTEPSALSCPLPKPDKDDEIVVVDLYSGAFLSSVSVVGQDKVTTTVRMVVEPGDKSIYLVLMSHGPLIWKLEGLTDRLSNVAMIIPGRRHPTPAGLTGMPGEKVTILSGDDCHALYYRARTRGAEQIERTTELILGRKPVSVTTEDRIAELRIPSGSQFGRPSQRRETVNVMIDGRSGTVVLLDDDLREVRRMPRGFGGHPEMSNNHYLWDKLSDFDPKSYVQIDLSTVVASSPAVAYEVAPRQAGLLQLLRERSIKILSDGSFLIQKPIARYPPGLHGGLSVKFVIGKGVPPPAGDPGHSCVALEETGRRYPEQNDPRLARDPLCP